MLKIIKRLLKINRGRKNYKTLEEEHFEIVVVSQEVEPFRYPVSEWTRLRQENPEEYFAFIAQLRHVDKATLKDFLQQFEDFFNGEILDQKKYLRDFSKGNQKKVGLAASFIGDPSIVILDEPFANLDPSSQIRLKSFLASDLNKDKTLLISSHDLNHVTDVCERIVLLEKGKVIKDTPKSPATLKELEAYFSGQ